MSSNNTNDKKVGRLKSKEYDRIQILNALIELGYKINLTNPINKNIIKSKIGNYHDIGFLCSNIMNHLNNKTQFPLLKEIEKIEKIYNKGKINKETKDFRIKKIKSKFHFYDEKAVQRTFIRSN